MRGVCLGVLLAGYVYLCLSLVASISQLPMAKLFTPGNLQSSIPLIALLAIGYLAFILTANVVMRIYLLRDVWARVMAATTIHDIEAVANVSARGELANALGEGFADGLDLAGF